jgi:hypothetical protein
MYWRQALKEFGAVLVGAELASLGLANRAEAAKTKKCRRSSANVTATTSAAVGSGTVGRMWDG